MATASNFEANTTPRMLPHLRRCLPPNSAVENRLRRRVDIPALPTHQSQLSPRRASNEQRTVAPPLQVPSSGLPRLTARRSHAGKVPLLSVYAHGGVEACRRWLEGAFPGIIAVAMDGVSMLMAAATDGHSDLVELLLRSGADVDAQYQESGGRTALMRACAGLHFAVVQQLLAAGATMDLTDAQGQTAFDRLWQASRDHGLRVAVLNAAELVRLRECIRVFTEHAAEVHAQFSREAAATHTADPSSSPQRKGPGAKGGQPALTAEEVEFQELLALERQEKERERREKEALGSWAQQQIERKRELKGLYRENERREKMMVNDLFAMAALGNSIKDALGYTDLERAEAMAKGWVKQVRAGPWGAAAGRRVSAEEPEEPEEGGSHVDGRMHEPPSIDLRVDRWQSAL